MLIRDFIEVPRGLDAVVAGVSDRHTWERAVSGALDPEDRTMLVRYGIDGLFAKMGERACVHVGPPRQQARGTVMDVAWPVPARAGKDPTVVGDVALTELARGRTHVQLDVNYTPSRPDQRRPAEFLALQRVVATAVRLVLEHLVVELTMTAGVRR
jgi:hypothetical protein